ncbi:RidA family protein [Tritonibacter mobilis]|nr:RidA family protein [Tritonibacter mobilis]
MAMKNPAKLLAVVAMLMTPSVALAEGNSITRSNPEGAPDTSQMGYSQVSVVESGRLAFISGQVAWKEPFGIAPESLADQTAVVLENADAILKELGASKQDIAVMRIYVTDLTPDRMGAMFPQVISWLDGAAPSLTGVGVSALAAPDLQIEMEMTVSLPN